jgi:hypothetical protein
MNTKDRYFTACVDLHSVKQRIERIIGWIEDDGLVPSIEQMAACIQDLTHAMASTAQHQRSDPRFKPIPPCCERGCGYTAEHHVCDLLECRH